jgi:hypothetical protein
VRKYAVLHAFWTLVGVKSDLSLEVLALLADFPGVTQAANFNDLVFNKKAGELEIAVDVLFLSEVEETVENIFEEYDGLCLLECSSGRYSVFEITLIAELGDDVAIVDSAVDIVVVDEIGMTQLLMDFNLDA